MLLLARGSRNISVRSEAIDQKRFVLLVIMAERVKQIFLLEPEIYSSSAIELREENYEIRVDERSTLKIRVSDEM